MTDTLTDKRPTDVATNVLPDVGIAAQLSAIELLVANHGGKIDILRGLVERKKRAPEELKMAEAYLPAARQAIKTLRFVAAHADAVRALAKTEGASGDASSTRGSADG